MVMQPAIPYEELLDWMEEKNKTLKVKLANSYRREKEWQRISNALAHAVALLTDNNTTNLWMLEAYRKWENKTKETVNG